jgi:hypothetical protein
MGQCLAGLPRMVELHQSWQGRHGHPQVAKRPSRASHTYTWAQTAQDEPSTTSDTNSVNSDLSAHSPHCFSRLHFIIVRRFPTLTRSQPECSQLPAPWSDSSDTLIDS